MAPRSLTETGRREIRYLLRSYELEVSAITCPLRFGLGVPENLQQRLDYIHEAMAFAFDLGPRLVILQAGRVPLPVIPPAEGEQPTPDAKAAVVEAMHMKESLTDLGKHGDRTGALVALDTGIDSPETLMNYLAGFDTGSLVVNFNPANLVIAGFNPYQAVTTFGRRLAHVHAQDARRISPNRMATVPLGHGDIDWMQMLASFEEVGYRGTLAIPGDTPAEVAASVAFLRRFVR